MKKSLALFGLLFISLICFGCTLNQAKPELKSITFSDIYPHALRGDIKRILEILDSIPNENLTKERVEIKEKYYKRFREQNEPFVLKVKDPVVGDIIKIYQNHWKKTFLQELVLAKAEKELDDNLMEYLCTNDLIKPDKAKEAMKAKPREMMLQVLKERGYYAIAGRTQPYLDLLIWQKETTEEYLVELPETIQKVKVVFMKGFITLGWEEYATFGKLHPGGWATKEAIYCVKESYDISSEHFKLSILVHEGQHFADYKLFPELKQADLEYRAKLAELSKAEKTIYNRIKSFKNNSKYDKKNPHQFAEYCLIRDLSEILFNQDFVSDMKKWKAIPYEKINEASTELLKRNTKQLKSAGAESVTELLK